MKSFKILAFVSLFSLMAGCKKEEIESNEYPRINTLEVTNITKEGVVFNGEIISLGNTPVVNYGFVWSDSEIIYSGGGKNMEKILISGNNSKGKFSKSIDFALKKDVQYTVSAIVQTDSITVFGEAVSFYSKGSIAPEVDYFEPESGQIGDTINIYGSRFSSLSSNINVLFGDQKADLIESDNDHIVVVVPPFQGENVNLSVVSLDDTVQATDEFKLLEIELNDFSPKEATYGDEITLTGSNFGNKSSVIEVYFGDQEADILENEDSHIKVSVPAALNNKESTIKVVVGNQEGFFTEKFKLADFVLESVSDNEATSGDEITIYGENLNGEYEEYHTISLGGYECVVTNSKATELTFTVPYDITPGEYELSLTLAGTTYIIPQKITIDSPWKQLNDFTGTNSDTGGGFLLNDTYFYINDDDNSVWCYNVNSDVWKQKNDLEGTLYGNSTGVGLNECGLFGLGYYGSLGSREMYKYNTDLDSWTQITSLPDRNYHQRVKAFGVGNDAYVFLGNYDRHFWKYKGDDDTWEQLNSITVTGTRYASAGFLIDNVIYIIGGLNGHDWNYYRDVWAYDIDSGEWTQMQSFPGEARNGAVAFELNGKGYFGLGISDKGYKNDFYEYNPQEDSWTRLMDFEGTARTKAIGFSYVSNGFIGLGNKGSSSDNLVDMWKFTPVN